MLSVDKNVKIMCILQTIVLQKVLEHMLAQYSFFNFSHQVCKIISNCVFLRVFSDRFDLESDYFIKLMQLIFID